MTNHVLVTQFTGSGCLPGLVCVCSLVLVLALSSFSPSSPSSQTLIYIYSLSLTLTSLLTHFQLTINSLPPHSTLSYPKYRACLTVGLPLRPLRLRLLVLDLTLIRNIVFMYVIDLMDLTQI